jgi:voltage-gated potassium channel
VESIVNRFFAFTKRYITLSSSLLLSIIFITIFVIPLFPNSFHRTLFSISYTIIFILSAASIRDNQKRVAFFALTVIIVQWISMILNMQLIFKLSLPINFMFFILIAGLLIVQIAKAKNVTKLVLLESIIGYLLLGICFSIMIAILEAISPDSFNFQHVSDSAITYNSYNTDYTYFALVSLTSTGYGDFLPKTPAAKSLSNLISITGQLYIAIIIAMLVGKYLSKSDNKNET